MEKSTFLFLYSLAGTAAFVSLSSFQDIKDEKKGEGKKSFNVVYIMCDDHSYQTISTYDQRYMQTPNIDRIANEGVRFTNSFVANSLSGPSRACMLTGKHSHANGFTDNSTTFDGSQQTFPKLLRNAGYQTAMIGKWHLVSEPTGFDYWDILVGQGNYYNPDFINNGKKVQREGYATNIITDLAIDWLDEKRDKEKPFCLFIHHKAPHRTWMPDLCDLDLYEDVVYPLPENFYDKYEGRVAASLQEMSIIKDMDLVYDLKMADKENEIHTQTGLEQAGRSMYSRLSPEQKLLWDKHYDPIIRKFKEVRLTGKALAEWKYQQYMHDYMRVIHSVDRNVGRVLDYLEKNGLLENTMIVYTSDQGFTWANTVGLTNALCMKSLFVHLCWYVFPEVRKATSTRWCKTSIMVLPSLILQVYLLLRICMEFLSCLCFVERKLPDGASRFITISMNIRQNMRSDGTMECVPNVIN